MPGGAQPAHCQGAAASQSRNLACPGAQAFPLALRLAFRKTPLTQSAPSLGLTLRYLPALHLVAVEANRKEAEQGAHARPSDYALLGSLYPGDDGSELPARALAAAGGVGGGVDVRQLPGKPYRSAGRVGFQAPRCIRSFGYLAIFAASLGKLFRICWGCERMECTFFQPHSANIRFAVCI